MTKERNITLNADQIYIVLESLNSVAWEISAEADDAKRAKRELFKALSRPETIF